MRIYNFVFLFASFGLAFTVHSQNLGYSSYSRIGIGDLAEPGSSRNAGMGGAGVGSYHQFQVNALNPATLGVLKYTNFEFDIAGKRTTYSTLKEGKQRGTAANIQYISLAIPLHKRFVMQLGAKPFSSVAYRELDVQSARDISGNAVGTKLYDYERTGSGGLSDIFLGAAYNYKDWLFVGVNGGIVLGQSVYETSVIEKNANGSGQSEGDRKFNTITERYEQHIRVSPGILITREIKNNKADLVLTDSTIGKRDSLGNIKTIEVVPVSKNWFYGLGITGSFFSKLQAQEHQRIEQYIYSFYQPFVGQRGAWNYYRYNTDTTKSGEIKGYSLPASFRIGLSLYRPNKINFVLDYNFANWGNYNFNQYYSKPKNTHGVAFGAEYIPDYNSIKYYKRVAYRGGINFSSMPYEVAGQSIAQVQATLGAGLVFPKTGVTLNVSIAYGQRGTTNSNLVKESYWLATIGIISNTKWFQRRKHD